MNSQNFGEQPRRSQSFFPRQSAGSVRMCQCACTGRSNSAGFGESCKKNVNVDSAHVRNFPFIFNVKFHACAKIGVEIFCKIPQNRSVQMHAAGASPTWSQIFHAGRGPVQLF